MKDCFWSKLIFALLAVSLTLVACEPPPPSSTPTPQPPYVLLTSSEARKRAEDCISALTSEERFFPDELMGGLMLEKDLVSGVKINNNGYALIGITNQQLIMSSGTVPGGPLKAIIYALFINTVDLEIVGGAANQVIRKGVYAWGVAPTNLYLTSITKANDDLDIDFVQPFALFETIDSTFTPIMTTNGNGFSITIAGKQIDFQDTTSQNAVAEPTPVIPILPVALPTIDMPELNVFTYPFAIGNSWTFSKTVQPGYNVQFWVQLNAQDGGTGEILLDDTLCSPGTYQQTFTVVQQISETAWEIKLTSPSDECLGRYRDASQIVWSVEPKFVSAEHQGQVIVEKITYPTLPDDWILANPEVIVEPIIHTQILAYILSGPENYVFQDNFAFAMVFYTAGQDSPHSTPAGELSACTISRATFSQDLAGHEENRIEIKLITGWQELITYCNGVGFAEFQEWDLDGNVVYKMELVEYRLTTQP